MVDTGTTAREGRTPADEPIRRIRGWSHWEPFVEVAETARHRSLMAYGDSLSLPALFVVNTASSLLAGLMPVPGGIGVAEASLAAGLMAYGVPSTTAGAAALTHRLVTFYLPPIWGWFAFRWLSRHEYL